jgi:hypothetical protein
MHWAWSQVLPPAPKLILMALADNADDAGYCWPRVKKIAERCSVSERTVQRTLKNFETSALLKVIRRFRPEDGRQTSNGYQLGLQGYPDRMSPTLVRRRPAHDIDGTPGVTRLCRGEGVRAVAPQEPPQQPSFKSPPQPDESGSWLRMPESLDPLLVDAMESLLLPCGRVIGQAIADEVEGLAAKGMLRASPLKLAASLRDRASAGTFTPRAGLEVAVKRATAEKKRMEENRKAQANADRLAKERDSDGLERREAARVKAMEELKKRGFVA